MPHPLQRAIMPIVLERNGRPEIVGTAFAIGSGTALTATHTLVDDGRPRGTNPGLLYIGGTHDGGNLLGGLLPILHLNFNATTDIALVRFELPLLNDEPLRHGVLSLSFESPAIDNRCLAVGYTAGFTFEPGEPLDKLSVSPKLHATKGVIQDLHHAGRDRTSLPFPVFLTDARFDSQMSGSPILSGGIGPVHVIGIVATGFEMGEGLPATSYGSLLWPAAGLRLPFLDDTGAEADKSLLEMAEAGWVKAESLGLVSVDKSNSDAWTVSYSM